MRSCLDTDIVSFVKVLYAIRYPKFSYSNPYAYNVIAVNLCSLAVGSPLC